MSLALMRLVGAASFIAVIFGLYWYVDHSGYERGRTEVQSAWDADKTKRAIDSAAQAAEARETERVADEKVRISKLGYEKARADLAAAIADIRNQRLCATENLPRGRGVRVADGGSPPVSGTSSNPSGTGEAAQTSAGVGQGITIGDALEDTLQCSRLIDLVISLDLVR